MTFSSILFQNTQDCPDAAVEAPAFFLDLNLDQVVDALTAGKQEYDLQPFFYTSLHNVNAVQYRHEVFQDLQERTLFKDILSFARKMRSMREHLVQAEKLYYQYQKESWFLEAVQIYCDAVRGLAHDLSTAGIKSRRLFELAHILSAATLPPTDSRRL